MHSVDKTFTDALRSVAPFIPELPEVRAYETYARIRALEASVVLPEGVADRDILVADYAEGSAQSADELWLQDSGGGTVLASADHATDPVRKATGIREAADHGTGGLTRLLAEKNGVTAIIPVGKQTGNAATTPDHPIKITMNNLLPARSGFLSVHGMMPGKLVELSDKTEIHALIGLGKTPNELSRSVAEALVGRAADLGLRALISNDIQHKFHDASTGGFVIDPASGEPKQGRLAALGVESTTNHAYRIMAKENASVPAFQIEMTRLLRLLPSDFEGGWHADKKARAMGVYLGYLLAAAAVELIQDNSPKPMVQSDYA